MFPNPYLMKLLANARTEDLRRAAARSRSRRAATDITRIGPTAVLERR
jgi:hypothetical protein